MVSQMYQLFYWELFRYMKKSAGSIMEAEDIVQETFLRALENSAMIDAMQEAQCRAWLYRTAKNILIDRVRHTKAQPELSQTEGETDDLTRSEVMQLCRTLEADQRTIFLMRYFEGYNASELGKLFQMPASTVRAKLAAARRKLAGFYPELKRKDEETWQTKKN